MNGPARAAALVATVALPLLFAAPAGAEPSVLRVPKDHPTVQAAVDAAVPGDQIRVGPGDWCGATITKRLDLVGEGGATIVGCPAPHHDGVAALRIGFFLPGLAGSPASGTTIRHFVFDGQGVSNSNLTPLAFAIFARDVDGVLVQQNAILGTIQAITNTRGSGWDVSHNDILELSVLTCDGFCGGGDAIVFQARPVGAARGVDNSATFNVITGAVPDNLDEFSMVGVLAIAQDGVVVRNNRIAIAGNPAAAGAGEAIVITDHCCGLGGGFLTSINTVIVNNDGRDSQFAVVIERDAGGGTGNSEGAVLRGNFGLNSINEVETPVTNRSRKTLQAF